MLSPSGTSLPAGAQGAAPGRGCRPALVEESVPRSAPRPARAAASRRERPFAPEEFRPRGGRSGSAAQFTAQKWRASGDRARVSRGRRLPALPLSFDQHRGTGAGAPDGAHRPPGGGGRARAASSWHGGPRRRPRPGGPRARRGRRAATRQIPGPRDRVGPSISARALDLSARRRRPPPARLPVAAFPAKRPAATHRGRQGERSWPVRLWPTLPAG
jgi:hypothetical protein